VATHSDDFVSRADFNKLSRKLEALESKTTDTSSRLADVEKNVSETKGDTTKILDFLMAGKKEQKTLPAPSRRKEIMLTPTEVVTESESEDDEVEYVPYGKGDQERYSVVPIWGKKKKSTPVACKGGSAAVSSSSSSSSERKDLSRAAGGGAMVVASKSKHQPLPETLCESRKERSSSPRKLRGTGLIQCTDLKALVALMERDGYTEVPVIVKRTKEVSVHFKTAIANAHALGVDEAEMLAMLSADSGRSASRIPEACQIRDSVIGKFSPNNVAMFMNFFARMAENYNSRSDKGVDTESNFDSYVLLGTNKKTCTSFLKYLRDN
jgi:hypothetical protein